MKLANLFLQRSSTENRWKTSYSGEASMKGPGPHPPGSHPLRLQSYPWNFGGFASIQGKLENSRKVWAWVETDTLKS